MEQERKIYIKDQQTDQYHEVTEFYTNRTKVFIYASKLSVAVLPPNSKVLNGIKKP